MGLEAMHINKSLRETRCHHCVQVSVKNKCYRPTNYWHSHSMLAWKCPLLLPPHMHVHSVLSSHMKPLLIKSQDRRGRAGSQGFMYPTFSTCVFYLKSLQRLTFKIGGNQYPVSRTPQPRKRLATKSAQMLWFCYIQDGPGSRHLVS